VREQLARFFVDDIAVLVDELADEVLAYKGGQLGPVGGRGDLRDADADAGGDGRDAAYPGDGRHVGGAARAGRGAMCRFLVRLLLLLLLLLLLWTIAPAARDLLGVAWRFAINVDHVVVFLWLVR
jgi:hypothetical protein